MTWVIGTLEISWQHDRVRSFKFSRFALEHDVPSSPDTHFRDTTRRACNSDSLEDFSFFRSIQCWTCLDSFRWDRMRIEHNHPSKSLQFLTCSSQHHQCLFCTAFLLFERYDTLWNMAWLRSYLYWCSSVGVRVLVFESLSLWCTLVTLLVSSTNNIHKSSVCSDTSEW